MPLLMIAFNMACRCGALASQSTLRRTDNSRAAASLPQNARCYSDRDELNELACRRYKHMISWPLRHLSSTLQQAWKNFVACAYNASCSNGAGFTDSAVGWQRQHLLGNATPSNTRNLSFAKPARLENSSKRGRLAC